MPKTKPVDASLEEREQARCIHAALLRNPRDFPSLPAVASRFGLGTRTLEERIRDHYEVSAGELLQRARVAGAREALSDASRTDREVARAVGFENVSELRSEFSRRQGLSTSAYRRLGDKNSWVLSLPDGFRCEDVFGLFGRDADGCTELVEGRSLTKALQLGRSAWRVVLDFGTQNLRIRVEGRRAPSATVLRRVHARVVRMLNLASDSGAFERKAARVAGFRRLLKRHPKLRIPQTMEPYEALVWVIVGQQVNLTFASVCRSRLIELCGKDAGGGFRAHPRPEAVARLDYEDLTRLQYSRRKAEYVIDISRMIADGALELEALEFEPTSTILETLLAVRGLGPWSINYLLLRAFGREDSVPVGDAGLVAALQRFFELDQRPGPEETLQLMEPFRPYRSLATYHLWKSLG